MRFDFVPTHRLPQMVLGLTRGTWLQLFAVPKHINTCQYLPNLFCGFFRHFQFHNPKDLLHFFTISDPSSFALFSPDQQAPDAPGPGWLGLAATQKSCEELHQEGSVVSWSLGVLFFLSSIEWEVWTWVCFSWFWPIQASFGMFKTDYFHLLQTFYSQRIWRWSHVVSTNSSFASALQWLPAGQSKSGKVEEHGERPVKSCSEL